MTGACGMRNAAGVRPPSSSGASSSGWRPPRHDPYRSGSGSHSSKLRRPSSSSSWTAASDSRRHPARQGTEGLQLPRSQVGTRRALCQQHCGFLMQSTWCVGHAGTEEAACAAVPVSIKAGPAAKAVASAAEASTYLRAARGRPCFRLINFPFGRRLRAAARWGPLVPQGVVSGAAWQGPLKQR